jgi:alkylglycerol monooxygenase
MNKVKVFLKPPGWQPKGESLSETEDSCKPASQKYSPAYNTRLNLYLSVQFLFALFLATLILFFHSKLSALQLVSATLLVIFTLTTCGALFEHKYWLRKFEYFRLLFWLGTIFTYMPVPGNYLLIYVNTGLCISSFAWFYLMKHNLAYVETPSQL